MAKKKQPKKTTKPKKPAAARAKAPKPAKSKPAPRAKIAKPKAAKPKKPAKPRVARAKTAEEVERQSAVVQFLVDGMGDDEDFRRRVRLEELLGAALTGAGHGSCDGGDGGSGSMNVFLGITDPAGARQTVIRALADSGNAEDTVVAYSDDASTGAYDVWWPANYPYTFTIFGPMWKGPLPAAELNAMPADLRALQGVWRVTRFDGPDGSRFSPWWEEVRFMIVRDRLTMRRGAAVASDARFVLRPEAKPKEIDMHPTIGPNRGVSAPGIYRVSGDTFELCVSRPDEPRPAEIMPEADHQDGRLVLRREAIR